MVAQYSLKVSFLITLFFTGVLAVAAVNAKPVSIENDAEGFLKKPVCGFHKSIIKTLAVFSKETPTGIKASNNKWDMEIYTNTETGTWTLVGKSKDPGAKKFQLCHIALGVSSQPYTQQKWYDLYFKNNAKPGG